MTTPIHSARNPKTERWLDQLGVTWTFDPDLPLHRIDQAASLANQVRHIALDPIVVERYANDTRHGDTFPAVLVDAAAMALLGGNHRFAARQQAGQATIAAYLITGDPTTLLRIAVEDNRNHGLATSKPERLDHGVALVAAGMSTNDAARIVGLPVPDLTTHAGVLDLARRLEGHDKASLAAKLPKTSRYALSMIDDSTVLDAAVDLVLDAALPLNVVRTIVDTTKAVEPVEALRVIGQMTEDYSSRITDRSGNLRKASMSERAKLDNALAVIKGLDPQAVSDSCPNDDVRAVLAQRIMDAAAVLAPTHEALTAATRKVAA